MGWRAGLLRWSFFLYPLLLSYQRNSQSNVRFVINKELEDNSF